MANLNKDIKENTVRLTKEINRIIENYIANRKYSKNNEKYTKGKFCDDVGVSRTVTSMITHEQIKSSITLDTAIRLLHGCGMTLKIVPELMPKKFYQHKDIIMPKDYEDGSE